MFYPTTSLNTRQKNYLFFVALIVAVLIFGAANAKPLEVQKVTDRVYALVGEMDQRSPDNLANNATFGVVITKAGIVLMDPGGSFKGAAQIDAALKTITDKPVKIVINTGGQDHRWLGNGYWQQKGAKIIASSAAVADQKDRVSLQMTVLGQLVGDEGMKGTEPVYATQVFEESHSFEHGGIKFQLTHKGAAHTPGDSFVYIPSMGVVFAGDIVYVERLLGVGGQSSSSSWLDVFKAVAALKPKYIVPGHGHATTLKKASEQTYEYLINLRKQVAAHLENGGDMKGVVNVEQSRFKNLKVFDTIAKRNAMAVFAEMEFE